MDSVSWVHLYTGLTRVVSSLEIFDGYFHLSAIGYRNSMGGIILGTIWLILLAGCNLIQDLHVWYNRWNYLMDSVSWMNLVTRLTFVNSSLEQFDVYCYMRATGYRTNTGGIIIVSTWWLVLAECNCLQFVPGWYCPWNNLIDSVMWVQLDTGFTQLVSSLEQFDG
jgi:hypothetical protein